ncbi:ATP-binding protein [Alteromonas macleodii]|uniref:ATP-binding protein n=1 Tax=Alteromonas macleodii TaxID=28108 RepID=UPI003BF7DB48
MRRKLIFIGGIHGVGKSTLCNKLISQLKIPHYSASELITRAQLGLFTKNKTVTNVTKNQDVLLVALNKFVDEHCLLLDGHFALFDANQEVQLVPLETFASIEPIAMCVLTCNIELALERIAARDGIQHDKSAYEVLSASELANAKSVAKRLNIPLFIHDTSNKTSELVQFISSHLE